MLLELIKRFHNPWHVAIFSVCISVSITITVSFFIEFTEFKEVLALSVFTPFVIAFPVARLLIFYTHKIQKEKEELHELNRIKQTLFAVISHDIRSPMITIKGVLSLAKDDNLSREEFKALTQKLDLNLDATISLMDNLIAWTKIQMGGYNLRRTHIHLAKVISDNIQLHEPLAAQKNIRIKTEGDLTIKAFADYDITKLVVRNLISNAIKFTENGGTINFRLLDNDDTILVSCLDTGIGISKKDLARLFADEKYYSRGGTNNEKGAGLGLKVCKQFMDLEGGKFWAESELGKGSNFTFTLHKNESGNG